MRHHFVLTNTGRLLGLILLGIVLRIPSFVHPIMDIDEAEYAGVVCRMIDGGLPYRDGVMIKFPGILYVYYAAFALFGKYNMLAVHVLGAIAGMITALVVRAIARRTSDVATPDEGAGWRGGYLYIVFSVGFYSKMQAANTEMFAVLPCALAVLAYLEARDRARPVFYVVSGLLGGAAVIFKQPTALLPVALALHALVSAMRNQAPIARAFGVGAALGFGSLAPLALLALGLHLQGILPDAIFWTLTYIWFHYFPSVNDSYLLRFLATPLPLFLSMAPIVWLSSFAKGDKLGPLWWWLGSMTLASFTGGRMFGHYFLLAIPALCVLAAVGWPRATWQRPTLIVTIALAIGQLAGALLWDASTDHLLAPKPDWRPAAQYIKDHTKPDERIFIWGRSPVLYVGGERCPSTRFVYAHHLAGARGSGDGRNAHSVPQGWTSLMADLEKDPPPYVLDTSHGKHGFEYAPLESYDVLWKFVQDRYTLETELAGVRFYRRR